jgi:hypothetical protein
VQQRIEAHAQAAQAAQASATQAAQASATQVPLPSEGSAESTAVAAPGGVPVGLRMLDLMARGIASGHAPQPIAGPRIALPAGLGGLVGASGAAAAIGAMGAGRPMPAGAWLPPPPISVTSSALSAAASSRSMASPSRASLAAPSFAPTFALPAVEQARPTVLSHIAWADRWLARMAGAQPRALAAFDVATASGNASVPVPAAFGTRPMSRAGLAPVAGIRRA